VSIDGAGDKVIACLDPNPSITRQYIKWLISQHLRLTKPNKEVGSCSGWCSLTAGLRFRRFSGVIGGRILGEAKKRQDFDFLPLSTLEQLVRR